MDKIQEIERRINKFKHDWEISRGCCDIEDFSDEVIYLLAENKRYREALEHYSKGEDDKLFWNEYEIVNDGGRVAREALRDVHT